MRTKMLSSDNALTILSDRRAETTAFDMLMASWALLLPSSFAPLTIGTNAMLPTANMPTPKPVSFQLR